MKIKMKFLHKFILKNFILILKWFNKTKNNSIRKRGADCESQ